MLKVGPKKEKKKKKKKKEDLKQELRDREGGGRYYVTHLSEILTDFFRPDPAFFISLVNS